MVPALGLAAAENSSSSGLAVLTILISVVSSATVGGIVVALLTGRQERDQQLRDKMLAAAADFASLMAKLHSLLQGADAAQREERLTDEQRARVLMEYAELYQQVSPRLIVVQMLYHPASAVYGEAGKILSITPTPEEARDFLGDPTGRARKIGGGRLTAEDIRYAMNFSAYFAAHVWEAIDNPRRRRGRRSPVPALAATARRRPPAATEATDLTPESAGGS
jgi:hypothetical protein